MVLTSYTEPTNSACRSQSPCSRTLACSHTAVRSPSLPPLTVFAMYSFTDPGGMEGWAGLVGRPICQPQIWRRAGWVGRPKTDVLTTELRRQTTWVNADGAVFHTKGIQYYFWRERIINLLYIRFGETKMFVHLLRKTHYVSGHCCFALWVQWWLRGLDDSPPVYTGHPGRSYGLYSHSPASDKYSVASEH